MQEYLDEVFNVASSVDKSVLREVIDELNSCASRLGTIFIAGNGGSAAIASHFATDLIKSGYIRGRSIKAISLVDNVPLITATSNDFSYSDVFGWQLNQLYSSGDIVFVISSSGNSVNIKKLLEAASKLHLKTISLSGFDGGDIAIDSTYPLITYSQIGSYGPVEDSHSIICHYIAKELRNA